MSVTVRLRNAQAVYSHGRWQSSDADFEAVLNSTIPSDQHSPSVPRPDLQAAQAAVAKTGAAIVNVSPPENQPDGTIY